MKGYNKVTMETFPLKNSEDNQMVRG